MRKTLLILLIIIVVARHVRGRYTTHNIETPPGTSTYIWDVEIRTMPSVLVASVLVPGEDISSPNDSFRQLAGFIFGDNVSRDKIAMTAPVTSKTVPTEDKNNEKIAMTAPVTSTSVWQMTEVSFVMPSKWTIDTLPIPNNPNVTISETDPKTLAVWKFGWYATKKNIASEKEKFMQALESNDISRSDEMTLAQYNDPWTPAWMRTNEWWVDISE